MAHSNQIREFLLTPHGIELDDVYLGPAGVLTGSARLAQEAREKADQTTLQDEMEIKRLGLESKRRAVEAEIASIQSRFEAEELELKSLLSQAQQKQQMFDADRRRMARSRKADGKRQENAESKS